MTAKNTIVKIERRQFTDRLVAGPGGLGYASDTFDAIRIMSVTYMLADGTVRIGEETSEDTHRYEVGDVYIDRDDDEIRTEFAKKFDLYPDNIPF